MAEEIQHEALVGHYASDAELLEGALQLHDHVVPGLGLAGDLDEEGVVVRRDVRLSTLFCFVFLVERGVEWIGLTSVSE